MPMSDFSSQSVLETNIYFMHKSIVSMKNSTDIASVTSPKDRHLIRGAGLLSSRRSNPAAEPRWVRMCPAERRPPRETTARNGVFAHGAKYPHLRRKCSSQAATNATGSVGGRNQDKRARLRSATINAVTQRCQWQLGRKSPFRSETI